MKRIIIDNQKPEYGNRHLPVVDWWDLYFSLDDGEKNRSIVVRQFVEFLNNPHIKRMKLEGFCKLTGNTVRGCDAVNDEDIILTSYIDSLERVETCWSMMCAVLESGNKLYFYIDCQNDTTNELFDYYMKGDAGLPPRFTRPTAPSPISFLLV